MPNANKIKGTRFESAIRDFALSKKLTAIRPAQSGVGDLSDVHVAGRVAVQAKDVAVAAYPKWLGDVFDQKQRAGLPIGVVVHKTRGKSIGDARVVMTLGEFTDLLVQLDLAERFVNSNPSTAYAYAQALVKR